MPFKSDAQRRLMYAAAEGKSDQVPAKVAQKFIADSGQTPPKRKAVLRRKKGKKG